MSPQILTRARTSSLTHRGYRRPSNEDRLLVRTMDPDILLLAVADGMGGPAGGEIAAELAMETLAGFVPDPLTVESGLVAAMEAANERVLAEAVRQPALRGMGCTLTAALVMGRNLTWGQVGDSRLYLHRDGELRQLTTDQNLAQTLVSTGRLTPQEARKSPFRHMLDQCVGCPVCLPVSGSLGLKEGDLLLLSTDGLHGELPPEEIAGRLSGPEDPHRKAEQLIKAALDAGGQDNITVVLAAF